MGSSTLWLERAVDHLDIALLLVTPERRVSYANAAAHRLFGLPSGKLENATLDRLTVPERRGELRNIDEVLSGGSARKVRSVVRREDGTRVDVTMIVEPCFDERDRVVAASIRYESVVHLGRPSLMPQRRPTTAPPNTTASAPPPFEGGFSEASTPNTRTMPAPPPDNAFAAPARASVDNNSFPARTSGMRFSGIPEGPATAGKLERVLKHQRWLEERLSVPSTVAPLDDPRERARALLFVTDSRKLLEEALEALSATPPSSRVLP